MLKFFSVFLFSILLIYACNQYLEPLVCNSFNGDINVQVRVSGTLTEKSDHRGSSNFLVTPHQTTIKNLDLSPEYSILVSNFYPFNNRINKCNRSIDYEKTSSPGNQKQTLFGDAVSLRYDYSTTGTNGILHNILMAVYGNYSGRIMKIPIMGFAT